MPDFSTMKNQVDLKKDSLSCRFLLHCENNNEEHDYGSQTD